YSMLQNPATPILLPAAAGACLVGRGPSPPIPATTQKPAQRGRALGGRLLGGPERPYRPESVSGPLFGYGGLARRIPKVSAGIEISWGTSSVLRTRTEHKPN